MVTDRKMKRLMESLGKGMNWSLAAAKAGMDEKTAPHKTIEKITYLAFMVYQLYLVWQLPWFPTQDGSSHLYNATILYDLLHGSKLWGEYFTHDIKAVSNLGFNLIAYPLLSVVSPFTAEKIFISIYIFLIAIATHLLIRTFAPSSPYLYTMKLLSIPVIFNFTLMMGFYSYVIAVPIFLLAISTAWRVRNKSQTVRFFCYNAAGAIVFYLHLIPFIFYLITLTIMAIVEYRNIRESGKTLAGQLLMITPLLALLASYFSAGSTLPILIDFSYLLSGLRALRLHSDLLTFSTVFFSPWQALPASVYLFVLLLMLLAIVKGCANRRLKICTGQKVMLLLVGTLILIYFVSPFNLGEGAYSNDRFPWVILLLLLPPLTSVSQHLVFTVRIGATIGGILLLCFNTVIFNQQSREVDMFLEGLSYSCTKGEGIMLYKPLHRGLSRVDVLLHAPSYYGIFNSCVDVGNYETRSSFFPVKFNRKMPALPPVGIIQYNPGAIDLSHYPIIKCILGWKLDLQTRLKLKNTFEIFFENEFLSVWRRR